jgi:N-acyl homoserine lactone hydrolase
MDFDKEEAVVSKRKLIELAEREPVALVVFGHDLQQWSELKKSPEYYD